VKRNQARPCRLIGLVTVTLLLTAGCGPSATAPPAGGGPAPGSTSSAKSSPETGHNGTDVMFLQMMVAREQETAQLIRLARDRPLRGEAATLAAAIGATQADEAKDMTGWLQGWNQPTAMDPKASAHSRHGGLEGIGPSDLAELKSASSEAFLSRFLNLLIAQQHNAVELARMETAGGMNQQARELAARVDQSRTAQISAMLAMVAER